MLVEHNASLKSYNTMGLEAKATHLWHIEKLEDLHAWKEVASKDPLIIGGGSNILLVDDHYDHVFINKLLGIEILKENKQSVLVEVSSGENWHHFVTWAVDQGYAGIENLALIPGTVGAAPIQNIGAYGVEQNDCFVSLKAYHKNTGEIIELDEEACRFGYRHSIFKAELKGEVFIVSVRYRLKKQAGVKLVYNALRNYLEEHEITDPTIQDVYDSVIAIRQSKLPDPKTLANCGSFFKNPIISKFQHEQLRGAYPHLVSYPNLNCFKVPAGWLIDQCGFKGVRYGQTGCYEKQALVIVNYGEASAAEIIEFKEKVQATVLERFGIRLEPEVNIIRSS